MNNKILTISILFTIYLSACKKPKDSEDKYHKMALTQDLIDYFAPAKDGSYYVFQDTVSGVIDTFTISGYNNTVAHNCFFDADGKEVVTGMLVYKYITSYSNQTIRVTLMGDCDLENRARIGIDFGPALGTIGLSYVNDNVISINPRAAEHDSILVSYHPTFTWLGENYSSACYLDNTAETRYVWGFYSDYDYVIAKNVGIVGFKSLARNQFWKLIDKNVRL